MGGDLGGAPSGGLGVLGGFVWIVCVGGYSDFCVFSCWCWAFLGLGCWAFPGSLCIDCAGVIRLSRFEFRVGLVRSGCFGFRLVRSGRGFFGGFWWFGGFGWFGGLVC